MSRQCSNASVRFQLLCVGIALHVCLVEGKLLCCSLHEGVEGLRLQRRLSSEADVWLETVREGRHLALVQLRV
jgi:hypothetical protein